MSIKTTLAALCVAAVAFCATPDELYNAIRTNNLAQLDSLTKDRANANLKDDRGITPLMLAAVAGSREAMKLLIDRGAEVNAKNAFDSTALMWSATDLEKTRLLLDAHADPNIVSKAGRTALLIAAMSDRSAAIVKLLIAKGADTKAVDRAQFTALAAAASGGDLETLKIMIDAGLDVNQPMIAGLTPLIFAGSRADLPAVKLLLAKGANVNLIASNFGGTVKNGPIALGHANALMFSVTERNLELVKALLDAGADVNVKDMRGMNTLMLAVATDHQSPEIISMVIAKTADLAAKDAYGATALDWARRIGNREVIDVLKRAGVPESGAKPAAIPPAAPVDLRPAVERGIALLEKTSATFFIEGGCSSCHAQNVTDLASAIARTRGVLVAPGAAAERIKMQKAQYGSAGPSLVERLDTAGSPDVPLYALSALAAANYAPDRMTDFLLANVVAQQMSGGNWHLGGFPRAPIEDGDFSRSALGIRAIIVFGAPGRAPEWKERIVRAKSWLASNKPATAEERDYQLLGLYWAGEKSLQSYAKNILNLQRPDGGWGQRAELASDAYATGLTLYALAQSGAMTPSDTSYQRAVKYLLSTQRADGSWYVASRAPKFQPYFESSFPYHHDQWISSMATGWASAALSFALEPAAKTKAGE